MWHKSEKILTEAFLQMKDDSWNGAKQSSWYVMGGGFRYSLFHSPDGEKRWMRFIKEKTYDSSLTWAQPAALCLPILLCSSRAQHKRPFMMCTWHVVEERRSHRDWLRCSTSPLSFVFSDSPRPHAAGGSSASWQGSGCSNERGFRERSISESVWGDDTCAK